VPGVGLLGIVLFDGEADVKRLVCDGLFAAGIVGLKVLSPN
jgi:hypothetical protein